MFSLLLVCGLIAAVVLAQCGKNKSKKKPAPVGAQWSPDVAEGLVGRGEDERSRSTSNKPAGDSFEKHTPQKREAKRAAEIKQRGPVANRDDYKTLNRAALPSSDFDKSLGIAPAV